MWARLPTCCGFIALICKPSKRAISRNFPDPHMPSDSCAPMPNISASMARRLPNASRKKARYRQAGHRWSYRRPSRKAVSQAVPFCWSLSYCWRWPMAVGSLCLLRTTKSPVWYLAYRNAWRRWSAVMRRRRRRLRSPSAKNRRPQRKPLRHLRR